MKVKTLKITLAGTLQCYGEKKIFDSKKGVYIVRTKHYPTHSAICGIIASAMGISRYDEEEYSNIENSFTIESCEALRPISICEDFMHNADTDEFTIREFIEDNEFHVTIAGDSTFIDKVEYALMRPIYPYYLGCRCCTPSKPLIQMRHKNITIVHMSANSIDKDIEDIDYGLVDLYAYQILDEYRIRGEKYCPNYKVGYADPAMDELHMAHLLADAVEPDLYMSDKGFAMDDIKYRFVFE